MTRLALERNQVWVYLAAIIIGLGVGSAWPGVESAFEAALWPVLIVLLFATFVQVPLLHLRDAFADYRFTTAAVIGNFVFIPMVVWGLVQFLPDDNVLRLGVLLVLLVPCTDWFISFTQLGGGDTARAIAITPLNLILQLALLPGYLWLFAGAEITGALRIGDLWHAIAIVLVPLGAAIVAEYWIEAKPARSVVRDHLAWWPIPALAVVMFLIAGAQVGAVIDAMSVLPVVVPVFIAFLVSAALLAKALAWVLRLPTPQGRTLAFSLGTRNSFVVLPLALALPFGWEITAVVIVVQSLVELFGMVIYLWWIPRRLFAEHDA
ncbi:arsenic resistance protein [Hoyosella rhizosphaerae]|uniref:Arsenic resistance protein n=1 Tax=Hoyosella rhizosphaerae TaxID=1755582 RepID=A0A916XAK0_9ACTN|nr:arsenic resistance protein [Hoyosella rhizosphaerae]MBN4926668.1 arsenic resistance protein [Hoyosella rhizosphaerae]GGC57406.1 arsenic resistance protein [Hoyosella rhizosphaerae]